MSTKSEDRFDAEIGPSNALAALLVFIHVGAGFAAFWLPIPILIKFALMAGLALTLARAMRLHALRNIDDAIVNIEVRPETLSIRRRGSPEWMRCECVACFIHQYVVVLQLKNASGRLGLIVPADTLRKSQFRELRARLRSTKQATDRAGHSIKA